MLSRARFKNHPIHPFLVPFPIAFGTGALFMDLVGLLAEWPTVWATATYLAIGAVATGLVAAIPGLVDYFSVVPPNSSARKRATNASSAARCGCSSLTATARVRISSSASQTRAIPPEAMGRMSR